MIFSKRVWITTSRILFILFVQYEWSKATHSSQKSFLHVGKENESIRSDNTKFKIYLRGLFAIYNRVNESCSETEVFTYSIQQQAMVLHAINKANSHPLLEGMELVLEQEKDCWIDTMGLNVTFLNWCQLHSGSPKKYWGMIGSDSSSVSVTVAKLLGLFHVPQISYGATSAVLSDKKRFPYFFRTVPPDSYKIRAIIHLLEQNDWTYVSFVYEDDPYGNYAFQTFSHQIQSNSINVCLAVGKKLKRNPTGADLEEIVQQLINAEKAKVVIVFAPEYNLVKLLKEVNRQGASKRFQWIGADGWHDLRINTPTYSLNSSTVTEDISEVIEGAIVITGYLPSSPLNVNFESYIRQQTIGDAKLNNPYFADYLSELHNCSWKNGTKTSFPLCDDNLTIPGHVKLTRLGPYADAAVYAFAQALRNAKDDVCNQSMRISECREFTEMKGETFANYLKNVTYVGDLNNTRLFDKHLDGPAVYSVWEFNEKCRGNWQEKTRLSDKCFEEGGKDCALPPLGRKNITSTCSEQCKDFEIKEIIQDKPCCWTCKDCGLNRIVVRNHSGMGNVYEEECIQCDENQYAENNECKIITVEFLSFDEPAAYAVALVSCCGIIATAVTAAAYWYAWNTPVVRASGRELSVMILIGLFFIYTIPFLFCLQPTVLICALRRLGVGMSFALVYSSVLVKTVRISLVFNTLGKNMIRGYKRLLQPIPQIFIALVLTLVELFVIGIWIVFSQPQVTTRSNTGMKEQRSKNTVLFIDCKGFASFRLLVGLSYPMMLLLVCIVFAVKIRKVPVGFNEAKHIGFVVYTTFVIWLAQLATYIAVTSYNIVVRDSVFCFGLSLNGLIIILALFGPKLYIILFRPDKNNQKMVMELSSGKFSLLSQFELMRQWPENKQRSLEIPKTVLESGELAIPKVKFACDERRILSSYFAMYGDCNCCSNCNLKAWRMESQNAGKVKRRSLPDLSEIPGLSNSTTTFGSRSTIQQLISSTHSSMQLKRRHPGTAEETHCGGDSFRGKESYSNKLSINQKVFNGSGSGESSKTT